MSAVSQLLNSLATSNAVVNPGATKAIFIDVLPGQVWTLVKNIGNTGGLEILQCSTGASLIGGGSQVPYAPNFTSGSTQTLNMLAALSGTGYTMANNEVLTLPGPCRFYVSAPSASCSIAVIKGLGTGV